MFTDSSHDRLPAMWDVFTNKYISVRHTTTLNVHTCVNSLTFDLIIDLNLIYFVYGGKLINSFVCLLLVKC